MSKLPHLVKGNLGHEDTKTRRRIYFFVNLRVFVLSWLHLEVIDTR
jgi:hypothetical protein